MQSAAVDQAAQVATLSASGWTFMLTSLVFVWGLTLWCFKRVLSAPTEPAKQVEDFHSA